MGDRRRPSEVDAPRKKAPWRSTGASDLVYYTDRETAPGCDSDSEKKGVFRNNRGLVITLIDLLFVTVLFIVYLVFLRPMADQLSLGGYTIDFELVQQGESVTVIGEVERARSAFGADPPPQREQPIITMRANGKSISDLVAPDGKKRIISIVLEEYSNSEGVITVEVEIEGEIASKGLRLR